MGLSPGTKLLKPGRVLTELLPEVFDVNPEELARPVNMIPLYHCALNPTHSLAPAQAVLACPTQAVLACPARSAHV